MIYDQLLILFLHAVAESKRLLSVAIELFSGNSSAT
jgi:hypothetical protein